MSKKLKVTQAKGKPVNQAWLILSNQKERFEERIPLVDLFMPDTKMHFPNQENESASRYHSRLAEHLWTVLVQNGFQLNQLLEKQYAKQLTCVWCGGAVITFGNNDPDNPSWEVRCSDCGYLYDED